MFTFLKNGSLTAHTNISGHAETENVLIFACSTTEIPLLFFFKGDVQICVRLL